MLEVQKFRNLLFYFLMVYWKGDNNFSFRYVKLGYGRRSKRRTAEIINYNIH